MLRAVIPTALSLLAALTASTTIADEASSPNTVLGFTAESIDGEKVALSQYEGDVLLIVNTASQCGYTPQYEGLQKVYEAYKDRGFQVLAFPANEFGGQEPGSNNEIKAFCEGRYRVNFPLFAKIVVKGEGQHPLYQFLTSKETNPDFGGEIPWNFTKFLVDRQGNVIARFEPGDKPESPEVTGAIEKALSAGK